jgi:para-nitrobenzyl esterase
MSDAVKTMTGQQSRLTSATVDIAQGTLRGIHEDGVVVFRGVPYAAAPTNERRFAPPGPAPSWVGVRPAHTPGPAAPQPNAESFAAISALVTELDPGVRGITPRPAYTDLTYVQPRVSEDCLYLDIWVPEGTGDAPLPVYVYYHGGANTGSSGSFVRERGANFARDANVIVVRPNYRMGALGWVHFGLLGDELPEAVNLGIRDQMAALEWVHTNVESFGGDPDAITVGGESAGATAVSHLLTNPQSRKLIRRAVIQSLSPFNDWCTQPRASAETVAGTYLQILGVKDIRELKTIDWKRLVAAQSIVTRWLPPDANAAWRSLGGVVDGTIVPVQPIRYLTSETTELSDKEFIFGFAKDEWQFFRGHSDTIRHGDRAAAVVVLDQVFGSDTDRVYDGFRQQHTDKPTPGHVLSDAMAFEFFKWGELQAALNLSQRSSVRVFQFAWDMPGLGGELRALHTADIPFLWGNYSLDDLAHWPQLDGVDRSQLAAISGAMRDFYGRFIHCGDPGPEWPKFDFDSWQVLSFGEHLEVVPGLLRPEWELVTSTSVTDLVTLEEILARNANAAAASEASRLKIDISPTGTVPRLDAVKARERNSR